MKRWGAVAGGACLIAGIWLLLCRDTRATGPAGKPSSTFDAHSARQPADVGHRSQPAGVPRARAGEGARRDPTPHRTVRLREVADESAEDRQRRLDEWNRLETFAREAALSDVQWQLFLGDVADLAYANAATFEDFTEGKVTRGEVGDASAQLDAELADRLSSYLDERQRAVYEFRLGSGLLDQVRRFQLLKVVAGTAPPWPADIPRHVGAVDAPDR